METATNSEHDHRSMTSAEAGVVWAGDSAPESFLIDQLLYQTKVNAHLLLGAGSAFMDVHERTACATAFKRGMTPGEFVAVVLEERARFVAVGMAVEEGDA